MSHFDTLDQASLAAVTRTIGLAMAAASQAAIASLVDDDSISPEVLIAAVAKAQAIGAGAAIAAELRAEVRADLLAASIDAMRVLPAARDLEDAVR